MKTRQLKRKTPLKAKKKRIKIRVNEIDVLFSRYVRLMSGGYCKRCHKNVGFNNLDCAHFHSRARRTVRWDYRNAAPLCSGCHFKIDTNPVEKYEFFATILDKKDFDEINRLANLTVKDFYIDKEGVKKDLEEKLRFLES